MLRGNVKGLPKTFHIGTNRVTQNVGNQLAAYATLCPRRAKTSIITRRKPEIKTDHPITVLRVLLLRSLVERYKCLRRSSRFHIQRAVGRRANCWPRAKEFESVTEWKGADLKRAGDVKVKTLLFIPVSFILLLCRRREQVTRKNLCLSTKLHIMS